MLKKLYIYTNERRQVPYEIGHTLAAVAGLGASGKTFLKSAQIRNESKNRKIRNIKNAKKDRRKKNATNVWRQATAQLAMYFNI